jgi:hypothetical protein
MQQQPPEEMGENLYTSATGDLSAGGVAMAREAAEQHDTLEGRPAPPTSGQPISDPTPAQIYAREDLVSPTERPTFVTDYAEDSEPTSGGMDATWAIAAGALVAVGGGVAAAWAYSRWQQERNRPINRVRRQARGIVSQLSDRFEDVSDLLPDVDDVRDTAPMSGGAAATLLGGLLLARMLHLGGWGRASQVEESSEMARSAWRSMRDVDVQSARDRVRSTPRGPLGLGLGGMFGVAAAAYLAWRFLRGGGSHTHQPASNNTWYVGTEGREQVPNQ